MGQFERGIAQGYDAFGMPVAEIPPNRQPFGYTGYQVDAMSGMYYAQARYYDAQAGRFISEDILKGSTALPQSLNAYTYCWNQPLTLVDRDGCSPRYYTPWQEAEPYYRGWDIDPNAQPRDTNEPIFDFSIGSPEGSNPHVRSFYGRVYGPNVVTEFDRDGGEVGLNLINADFGIVEMSGEIGNTRVGGRTRSAHVSAGATLDLNNIWQSNVGFSANASLYSGEIERRIPTRNGYLIIGVRGYFGGVGASAYFRDGKLRLGGSKGVGKSVTVGWERRGGHCWA